MNGYTGPVTVDDGEVAEARWAPLDELRRHAEQHPEQYTQWFLQEAASLGWFGAAPGGGTAVGGEPRDGSAAAAGQQRQQRQFAVA